MRASRQDLPVVMQQGQSAIRMTAWGGINVEVGEIGPEVASLDFVALFNGLPDNRCQCPHWGYIIEGRVRYYYADRVEVYETGDVYYVEPGHRPEMDAGTL